MKTQHTLEKELIAFKKILASAENLSKKTTNKGTLRRLNTISKSAQESIRTIGHHLA